ncbi:nitrate- and nitrite sensing domain-containing protein [Streptomyces sp. H10-C2]|uniref:nitrate- and nitrite sensing domain-containing protein n=1 Tax=unclassified Streptomyces TaxID=2593676 RepID=UPI0024BBBA4F|nr:MULTISPECIES: nitrate- and nitrite sensing domain-containing protein [unclassified Streptomyces]MDJ0342528.1 nitrate- and nitrite sensing domain-containing protein [Streptomyces sp. PH10-H1]MDJ0370575.1 nitrate- and nitrite sensing domain-containing protein [Streptomyces sp. H10-C2]
MRRRLLGALLVCAVLLPAAAAPGVAAAVGDLSDAQDQVGSAELAIRAISLAHSLADERDDMAAFVAGGRSTAPGTGAPGLSESQRNRVDRQAQGVSADPGTRADLRDLLATLPQIRQDTLTGTGTPQAVVTAYAPLLDALGRVAGPVVPPLSRATALAAKERGLLVSALVGSGSQRPLATDAQTAAVQERAALADFRATAPQERRDQYNQTVTGADVSEAERDIQLLTDQPQLTGADRALGAAKVKAALTARIGLMRSVESSLATAGADAARERRDDAVTALELRVALTALCLIITVGILVSAARSLTRPLAALHRFAQGRTDEARVVGIDEFAAVARRINVLVTELRAVQARGLELGAENTRLLGIRDALAAERDSLLRRRDAAGARTGTVQSGAHSTYVNLSLRTLGLVERQLALIEGLEEREQDPDHLETLFRLDHLATRMRRNSENLLVLAGAEHGHGGVTAKPVPLVDVTRAAISEIERYERVRIQVLPGGHLAGHAADDTSHLIAELLDNATSFSPPQAEVQLSGWMLENGEVMISVEDTGIGAPPERLAELNALLTDPEPAAPGDATGMGLYVVARLAARHGIRVQLREQKQGGIAAVVILPRQLLAVIRPDEAPSTPVEAAIAGEPMPVPAPGVSPEALPAGPGPAAGTDRGTGAEHTRPGEGRSDGNEARSRHSRADDTGVRVPAPAPEPEPEPAPEGEGITGKGLPQRVPRSSGLTGEPAARRPERTGPVDAEALRRKFGGLQQGLREGRRVAEQETGAAEPGNAGPTGETGAAETVEEASR